MPATRTQEQRDVLRQIADPVDGVLFWMTNYYMTFDKPKQRRAKWPGWPYLRDYVMELHNPSLPESEQQYLLVEKSRDMLVTLTTAGYMLYCVQFIPDWSGFITSRREYEVDDGGPNATTDSIFGMIVYGWRQQPSWMQMPLRISHLRIHNTEPGMNSYITGESANPNTGRGKSVTLKYGDEFAFMPQSHKVHTAMAGGNFRTLLYSSTPNFAGNAFYDLRHREDSPFRVLRYHYLDRPDRDEAWAERRRRTMSDLQWMTEYEIMYEFSSERNVYPRYRADVHTAPAESMPTTGEPYITFDEGISKPGAMYFALHVDGRLYILDEVYEAGIHVRVPDAERDNGVRDWVVIAEEMAEKHGYKPDEVMVACGHESRATASHFQLAGFSSHVADKDKLGRIRIVDKLMIHTESHKPRLLISYECPNLLWELPRYERKSIRGRITEQPKDGNDHGCDALGVLAQLLFPEAAEEEGHWTMDPNNWETEGVIGDDPIRIR